MCIRDRCETHCQNVCLYPRLLDGRRRLSYVERLYFNCLCSSEHPPRMGLSNVGCDMSLMNAFILSRFYASPSFSNSCSLPYNRPQRCDECIRGISPSTLELSLSILSFVPAETHDPIRYRGSPHLIPANQLVLPSFSHRVRLGCLMGGGMPL